MMLQKATNLSQEPAPLLRVGPVAPQDLPILHRLLDTLAPGAGWPVETDSPQPRLAFGGPSPDAFPPLAMFAAPEEAPTRRLGRILLVSDAPLPSLAGLAPVSAVATLAADLPLGVLDEEMAPADLVVTSDRRIAAYANGWLKPAILISQLPVEAAWPCLPFTLVGIQPQAFGLARRFDQAGTMPDLLNWKRQTVQRLTALLATIVREESA